MMRGFILTFMLSWACMNITALWAQGDFLSVDDGSATACSGIIYDTGGPGGPGYQPGESFTFTLCPEDETNSFIEWTAFNLDPESMMNIYDGEGTTSPLLATSASGSFFEQVHIASSSNESGCLTLQFVSGNTSNGFFAAIIGCGQPCVAPIPVVNDDNPSPLRVCEDESIVFDATGSIEGNAPIVTYQWDFDSDGFIDFESDSPGAEHEFVSPGIELVQLSLVDAEGCESIQPTNYFVYVSTDPIWNTTVVESACTGDEVVLEIELEGQPFTLEPGVDEGTPIELPDGVGVCYTSEVTVNSFLPGSIIENSAEAIEHFFINMEHSFLGDLDVTFICPDGSEMLMSSFINDIATGTDLGFPLANGEAGEGEDYYWSSTPEYGIWTDPDGDGIPGGPYTTLPSGTYAAESSWGVWMVVL